LPAAISTSIRLWVLEVILLAFSDRVLNGAKTKVVFPTEHKPLPLMLSIIVRKVREQKSGKIGHTEALCVSQRLQGCRDHRYLHQDCYPGVLGSVSAHVPVANIANTKYNSDMNMPLYILSNAVQCQLDRNASFPKNTRTCREMTSLLWNDIELSWKLHLLEHLFQIFTYKYGIVVTF